MDETGHARLTDFGLSAVASDFGSAGSITDDHAVRWAAPEILNMERSVSKESDVYSFGMVVVEVQAFDLIVIEWATHRYKIFTGKVPFYDSTPTAVAVDVLSGTRPARPAHPNLTNDLWGLTENCWNQDPQRRPGISEVILCLPTISIPRHGDSTIPDDMGLGNVQKRELPSRELSFVPPNEVRLSEVRRTMLPTAPANTLTSQPSTTFEAQQALPRFPLYPRRGFNPQR